MSKRQAALGLVELALDYGKVDWDRVLLDAAYRRPPFDSGDKEKGFRDALLVETFLQLVEDSPKSLQTCRVVLVSKDIMVKRAVELRSSGLANVSILEDIEGLRAL